MSTVLTAKKREAGPRSLLTQLRAQGQLPAVIYGYETEATPITLEYKQAEKAYRTYGGAAVFKIDVEGTIVNAMMTDIQRDALKGNVKHLDLLAINMKEELEVEVPFSLVGDSVGVKEGGVVMQPNLTLKIKVKPSAIPESVEVDITNLSVGDTLSLEQVRDKFDFEILNEDDYTLATVTPPSPTAVESDSADTADDVPATGEKLDPDKPGRED
ncbi:MAG: 50S ribosomal protein L25/general stress protein Ctc, partial [Lysinibacillus sp.]